MKSIKPALLLLFSLAAVRLTVPAHELVQSAHPVTGDLGSVTFPNSGAVRAQPDFIRGLLLLHSFEYNAARRSFEAAEAIDPGFAMAYWGEALTYNHTLWGEQNLPAARAALAKLGADAAQRAAKAPTAREQQYLAAVELLYGEGDKPQRDARYCAALETLARAHPEDLDARSLYSLALLGLSGGKRNAGNYMRAAAEAEAVLQINPHHPGALHYLIHATDDPLHAPLGLQAARLYGKVAPAASHAQHMPAHIFFALGMWDEAIAANVASLRISRSEGDGGYHSLLWLEYAYLQKNQPADAEPLIRSVEGDVSTHATKDNRLRLANARATWLIETRGAAGPDADVPVDSSGITAIGYFAEHDFARGITAAAAGNAPAASAALAQLRARIEAARTASRQITADWQDKVTDDELLEARAMALALDGTIKFYGGDRAAGLGQVRQAIDMTQHLEFEYGPPWSGKPLEELLGELLLAAERPAAAALAFQRALADYPNRRLATQGLAAARAATPATNPVSSLTKQALIGAWHLQSIEQVGPQGGTPDAFYGAGASGVLIYDPAGWMSVQIAGRSRPALDTPAKRPSTDAEHSAQVKAAALDTYYAYTGTWDFDELHSTVTHHVQNSLYPGEAGKSYTQSVTLQDDQLIFTTRRESGAGTTLQKKVWARLSPSLP